MKWLLIISLFVIGIDHHVSAQQKKDLDYFFLTDTVMASYGKTFTNKLKVVNYTGKTIVLFKNKDHGDEALLPIPDTVKLAAGGTQIFPVKYLPSAKQHYSVSFKADDTITLPDQAVFYVRLDEPNRIRINALEPDIYLDPKTGRVSIKLRCLNDGFSPVQIRLSLNSYPEGLAFENNAQVIDLAAGAQQIITLNAKSLLVKDDAPDFNVNIQAEDLAGKILATTSLRIVSLVSNKRLATGYAQYSGLLNNSVALNYVNLNNDFSFYQLRGNGSNASTQSALAYNLNLNYYADAHTMDAYDTWLSYTDKNFGVKLGNITDNLDYSLYGRGIKASAFLNEKNGFDAYYVNNNYLLFSGRQPSINAANTYAASYRYGKPGVQNGRISFIHNDDPYNKVNTNLINGEAAVIVTAQENLSFSAGYSYENNPTAALSKAGFGLGGLYTLQKSKWSLNLNNYFSSNYYSGLRRGMLQLDERFNYSLDSLTGLYLRYSKLKNNPNYLSQIWPMSDQENQITFYEIGLNRRINALSFTLYPYVLTQRLNNDYFTTKNLYSSSIRTALDVNYAFNKFMVALNVDYGYTKTNNLLVMKEYYHNLKINANFSAAHWGINARVQTNPYYLQEELIPVDHKKFRQYSFGPNLHFNTLKHKMEIALTGYTNYNNYGYGWNNTIDAQVNYRAGGTWQFSGQVFYNAYSNLKNSGNTQLRIGIQKSFAAANAPGRKKLELTFFGDDNANGVLDQGEKLLEGIIVDVEGTIAISNQKGKANYTNLDKGEKTIEVKNGKGWNQLVPLKLLLLKNQQLHVPLVKSGRLAGRIVPLTQKYVTAKPMLEGIRIIATDQQQRIFFTLSDENGNFYFSIPVGKYTIHIATAGQSFSIKDGRKEVVVNEKNNSPIEFGWIDERRKTEVKHF